MPAGNELVPMPRDGRHTHRRLPWLLPQLRDQKAWADAERRRVNAILDEHARVAAEQVEAYRLDCERRVAAAEERAAAAERRERDLRSIVADFPDVLREVWLRQIAAARVAAQDETVRREQAIVHAARLNQQEGS